MKKILIAVFVTSLLIIHSQVFAQAIDVNQATLEELVENLNGVGAHKAQAIIDYREQYGDFDSMEELLQVKGIGLSTLENNKDRLVFD
jgi:competence protein ComEA